jgi:hypothetical protein
VSHHQRLAAIPSGAEVKLTRLPLKIRVDRLPAVLDRVTTLIRRSAATARRVSLCSSPKIDIPVAVQPQRRGSQLRAWVSLSRAVLVVR